MSDAGLWRKKAQQDLDTAEFLHDDGRFGHAAFLYQQAAEKALKAVLVAQEAGVPQTHDCFVLAKQAEAPGEVKEAANSLSPYYFRTRYPDASLLDLEAEEISRVAEDAKTVLSWTAKRF